jgi:protein Tex
MPPEERFEPAAIIARELGLTVRSVDATLRLLEDGGTVPFIARYRKEATGDLDEVQIRSIADRREYLVDLEARKETVLASIREQGKLTADLERQIRSASTKAVLEDLYLPYKPKRRTRAQIARERGLEPLGERILAQPLEGDPLREAAAFVSKEKGVESPEDALAGARDIAAERISENAGVRAMLREAFASEGSVSSSVVKGKKSERTKFEQYYEFREAVRTIPSHRFLAVRRGESEGVLKVKIEVDEEKLVPKIARLARLERRSPFAAELTKAIFDAFERLLQPAIENDILGELKERADLAAVEVFAANLRNLLLAAPLGAKRVIGIDPGLRTGCKCAAVDATGKFLENVTLYLSQGEKAEEASKVALLAFVAKHQPHAIAIGNGTGGRETEAFVRRVVKEIGASSPIVVMVSEAGASVYSASDLAREEHPDLDLTVRGAISIARRLQDPLAELVKIDPKSIGVGQYQHDVHQPLLAKKLDEVVESCVNHVGVELNTASAELLAHVAGLGPKLAKKIVHHREKNGAFSGRSKLLGVSGLGPKTHEQCAGFLRVRGGEHPLDASAVHPERYPVVERMARDLGVALASLIGNTELVDRIELARYEGPEIGRSTLRDIVSELKKPGRDPRAVFEAPKFREDVNAIEDLTPGMELEGVVTNVTAFGAFVDVGVHQDGLVHVSQLADRFVRDPHTVVKAGDRIKVRVLEVDLERRRIALSAKSRSS